jgi:hypothetical protein
MGDDSAVFSCCSLMFWSLWTITGNHTYENSSGVNKVCNNALNTDFTFC